MGKKDEHTSQFCEQIEAYVYQLAGLMNLRNWTFTIDQEPCDPANLAEIDAVYGQCHAIVSVAETWGDMEPEDQRSTVVHELVHAHLAHMRQLTEDLFKLGGSAGKVAIAACNLAEEYAVEAIAQAWAPLLPLPAAARQESKKRRRRRGSALSDLETAAADKP